MNRALFHASLQCFRETKYKHYSRIPICQSSTTNQTSRDLAYWQTPYIQALQDSWLQGQSTVIIRCSPFVPMEIESLTLNVKQTPVVLRCNPGASTPFRLAQLRLTIAAPVNPNTAAFAGGRAETVSRALAAYGPASSYSPRKR
jgi:hypothetical protein